MAAPLILASSSPRRQELLRQAGMMFEVCPADISETRNPGELALDYALRLAQEKAVLVARQFPQRFVLGADTIVVVDHEVLGKPEDPADAERMLRLLSGRAHQVTTAISLALPSGHTITRSCTTQVVFRKLSEDEIQRYVATNEPMDKAGAYAIQGGAKTWVTGIEGDYSNVVGLPLLLLAELLRENNYL
jgi:septum formation protein